MRLDDSWDPATMLLEKMKVTSDPRELQVLSDAYHGYRNNKREIPRPDFVSADRTLSNCLLGVPCRPADKFGLGLNCYFVDLDTFLMCRIGEREKVPSEGW